MKNQTIDLYCPNCNNHMVKASSDEAKMRIKLIKWNRDGMFAVCKGCSDDVPINAEFMKSVEVIFSYEIEDKLGVDF